MGHLFFHGEPRSGNDYALLPDIEPIRVSKYAAGESHALAEKRDWKFIDHHRCPTQSLPQPGRRRLEQNRPAFYPCAVRTYLPGVNPTRRRKARVKCA